jgi:hypothetical protein
LHVQWTTNRSPAKDNSTSSSRSAAPKRFKGYPDHGSSIPPWDCIRQWPGCTTRATSRHCGRGSLTTRRALTTWTGCGGPRASAARTAAPRRAGACRRVVGHAVAVASECGCWPAQSSRTALLH